MSRRVVSSWAISNTFFVKGAFNTTAYPLVCELKNDGIDIWESLRGQMGLWQLPARTMGFASSVKECFAPKRMRSSIEAKTLKCTASEALTFYPFLAIYLQLAIVPAGRCLNACAVLLAMIDLLGHPMATAHAVKISEPANPLRHDGNYCPRRGSIAQPGRQGGGCSVVPEFHVQVLGTSLEVARDQWPNVCIKISLCLLSQFAIHPHQLHSCRCFFH